MSPNRRLVTCPVCRTDQHIYRERICRHDDGTLQCSGSKMPVKEASLGTAQALKQEAKTQTKLLLESISAYLENLPDSRQAILLHLKQEAEAWAVNGDDSSKEDSKTLLSMVRILNVVEQQA